MEVFADSAIVFNHDFALAEGTQPIELNLDEVLRLRIVVTVLEGTEGNRAKCVVLGDELLGDPAIIGEP